MCIPKGKFKTRQSAVRRPDGTFDRLKSRAESAGRTATYYVRETVEEHLEDLEDRYDVSEQASIGHRKSLPELEPGFCPPFRCQDAAEGQPGASIGEPLA